MTNNQINYWKNVETERHNREMEVIGREQNRIAAIQAETARQNASTASYSANEVARSNLARETETQRSNLASEAINLLRHEETVRSNQAYEAIGRTNAAANVSQAAAAARNAATNSKAQSETVRHNVQREIIDSNSNPWTSIATNIAKLGYYIGSNLDKTKIVQGSKQAINVATNMVSDLKKAGTAKTTIAPVAGYLR